MMNENRCRHLRALTGLAALLWLAACGEKPAAEAVREAATARGAGETVKSVSLERAGALFRQHCAQCHGANAEGAPDWRKRRPDGSFPAPPLDGTGHAWHHSMDVLKMTIRDGTAKLGGTMPAWGDKLSEAEIEAIIRWFQAKWPPAIRAEWQKRFSDG